MLLLVRENDQKGMAAQSKDIDDLERDIGRRHMSEAFARLET
jgi:hypothetical protein